jgi:octaprenyl-diphosphate synthase
MSEGEIIQIKNARKPIISEEMYFSIITKKTASLFSSCTICGAISANSERATINQMAQFGNYAGIAFQIKDDLFDYEKTNLAGKPVANDIKEKKITLPLIYAINNAGKNKSRSILKKLHSKKLHLQAIKEILSFTHEYGGIDYANNTLNKYVDQARQILVKMPDNKARESLMDLLEYITNRTS